MIALLSIAAKESFFGMNVKKTKTMIVLKQEGDSIKADIKIENETLEQVNTFKYLTTLLILVLKLHLSQTHFLRYN